MDTWKLKQQDKHVEVWHEIKEDGAATLPRNTKL